MNNEENDDESDETSSEGENEINMHLVANELLCYVQFYMHQSPKDNIAEVVNRFFSEE